MSTQESYPVFDCLALERILGISDKSVLIDFFEVFLSFTQDSWQDIEKASREKDFRKVSHLAHSLKASSHSVGALRLARAFTELELIAKSGDLTECLDATGNTAIVYRDTLSAIDKHLKSLQQSS